MKLNKITISWPLLLLGIISSLPYGTVMGAIPIWLAENGATNLQISQFALAGLPYSLSFFWSFFLDNFQAPFSSKTSAHRKNWIFFSACLTFISILFLSTQNPETEFFIIFIIASLICFFNSILDLSINAYRIEHFKGDGKTIGTSNYNIGFRFGKIIAISGNIHITSFWGNQWSHGFISVAGFLLIMTIICHLTITEEPKKTHNHLSFEKIKAPFAKILNLKFWPYIILFILTFRLSDSHMSVMSDKFLLDLGYNKIDIANLIKTTNLIATICGAIFSQIIFRNFNLASALFIAIILQSSSNLLYTQENFILASKFNLIMVSFIEKFSSGIAMIAIMTFISRFCKFPHIASQYAIFASISLLDRTLLSSPAGFFVDALGWNNFFIFSCFLSFPSLFFLFKIKNFLN